MNGFELNKIAASIFLAGLIAMVAGTVADVLYHPVEKVEKRGYQVEVADAPAASGAPAGPQIMKLGELLAKASAEAGKEVAKKCVACHTFDKGGPNKVGPNMWGIVNNKKAHIDGFAYSDAIKNFTGSKQWGYEELAKFLHAPKKYMPGTKMAFAGISKEEDLANLIAYLRSQGDSQPALPSADATVELP